MRRGWLVLALSIIFITGFLLLSFAEENQIVIEGQIEEVSADGNYIVINNERISVTQDFLEESYLEEGDEIKAIVEKTEDGLKIVEYQYIIDEEPQLDQDKEECVSE